MIVVCPSCRQRYRHEIPIEAEPPLAHCSGCDERFELTPPKRSYVLAQMLEAPVSSIEIDLPEVDPSTLAPEVTSQALQPGTAAVVTEPVESMPVPVAEDKPTSLTSRPGALAESLVALVPCGVGAAIAYYLAGLQGQDPVTWAALGGAVGLLLGWACLLWITRGD